MTIGPFGRITHKEAAAAKEIARTIQDIYGIEIVEDWGNRTVHQLQWAWPPVASRNRWEKGRWTIIELKTLEEAFSDLAALMGGSAQFRACIGSARVRMTRSIRARGWVPACGRSVQFRDAGSPPATVDVQNRKNVDKWTIVHEFAHVWDRKHGWRLSVKLEQYTKGHTSWFEHLAMKNRDAEKRLPGCNRAGYFYGGQPPKGSDAGFNRKEDFAESVAASVYPVEAQRAVAHYAGDALYSSLFYPDFKLTERWEFVQGLVSGTIVP